MSADSHSEVVRTCVGCRERAINTDLVRLALVENRVVFDWSRRLPGRGAHIHLKPECVRAALGRKALHRSFRRLVETRELAEWLETQTTVREERDRDENPMSTR